MSLKLLNVTVIGLKLSSRRPCAFVDLNLCKETFIFVLEFREIPECLPPSQNMDSLSEMLEFLDISARLDLKAVSVTHVLSTILQQVPAILFEF